MQQSTAAASRKQTSVIQDWVFSPDIFNSPEWLSVHTIHGRGCKDNENTSCTVIIISTTNYTQDILLLVQCHLLSQEENQWLSWAHELCRPLPCWNNSVFYLQKCHQVSWKNSLTQFFQNIKHTLKPKLVLRLATTERLRNGFVFNAHFCLECCACTAWRQTQDQNTELQWQQQHPLKYFWVGKLAASLCPLHTYANLLRKPAKVCVCTKTNNKFFKNTECIKKSKVWTLESVMPQL